jgi:hypothetical protein
MSRKDAWIDAIDRKIKMEGKEKHIDVLKTEMDVLASRLEPHDTGHLHTAIHVLKHRVEELEKEVKEDG